MTWIPPELRRTLEGRCIICGDDVRHPVKFDRKEKLWVVACPRIKVEYTIPGTELGQGERKA